MLPLASVVNPRLKDLFNYFLETGEVPDMCGMVEVVPLHEGGIRDDRIKLSSSNPVVLKIMELCARDAVSMHLIRKEVLSQNW